jgi:hypothetical protein
MFPTPSTRITIGIGIDIVLQVFFSTMLYIFLLFLLVGESLVDPATCWDA